MLWPAIISGFTLGAAGSLHCIGMCGPLSLALPTHHLSITKKLLSLLAYQFGRIITYSSLGLLFGFAGRTLYTAGVQQGFSIIMGIIVLALAAIYFTQKYTIHFSFFNRFYFYVQKIISRILSSPARTFSFFLMGMANGLLPCGMVYIALAATLSFNEISHSIAFMAMFGAGTLPAMMLIGYAGEMIKPKLGYSLRKIVPVFITLMGVVLILRGLNLGIPFISPQIPHAAGEIIVCSP